MISNAISMTTRQEAQMAILAGDMGSGVLTAALGGGGIPPGGGGIPCGASPCGGGGISSGGGGSS